VSEISVKSAPEGLKAHFARNLERLRVRANYTKTELARRVGVTRQTIDNWEGGDVPPFDNLIALMEALPASLQDLFGDAYAIRSGPTQEEAIADLVVERVRDETRPIVESLARIEARLDELAQALAPRPRPRTPG
jgi:transcriptional regulator with XRE-family HTH domain